jgi:hypothetical protein
LNRSFTDTDVTNSDPAGAYPSQVEKFVINKLAYKKAPVVPENELSEVEKILTIGMRKNNTKIRVHFS